jgi:predicted DCC family thiol-disulfide oxidoreductase YuxK
VGGSIGAHDVRSADRSRALSKNAAVFSELAKTAETPFIREYYWRLVRRYLMHAKNREKLARRSSEWLAADRHQGDQLAR